MSNDIWKAAGEGVELMGEILKGTVDTLGSVAMAGATKVAAGAGNGISSGVKGAAAGMKDSLPGPGIGGSKAGPASSGPSQEIAPSAPTKDFGALLESNGFAVSDNPIQSLDLGPKAAVGYGGVANNSHEAPDVSVPSVDAGRGLFS